MRATDVAAVAPAVEQHPGVYAPDLDSRMLMHAFASLGPADPCDVLDICCGSGIQAIAAAQRGHRVVAVDSQEEAIVATRRNAWLNRVEVEATRGELFEPVAGWRFDAVLANPPYVPTPPGGEHAAWCDGGPDGRAVIDRICAGAANVLHPGGSLWIVHSSLAGIPATLARLEDRGFAPEIVDRQELELGPVSLARRDYLVAGGFLGPDADSESLAVIKARRAPRRI